MLRSIGHGSLWSTLTIDSGNTKDQDFKRLSYRAIDLKSEHKSNGMGTFHDRSGFEARMCSWIERHWPQKSQARKVRESSEKAATRPREASGGLRISSAWKRRKWSLASPLILLLPQPLAATRGLATVPRGGGCDSEGGRTISWANNLYLRSL